MRHRLLASIVGALSVMALTVAKEDAQTPGVPTGSIVGFGPGVSAISSGGRADYILGGESDEVLGGGWLRIGYATDRVAIPLGMDVTSKGETGDSLAMPLDIEFQPQMRLGPVAPSVLWASFATGSPT